MSRRTVLVSVSIAAHFAVGFGVFASGIWELEKLESDTRLAGIGVMTPVMASGGGEGQLPEVKFEKKKKEQAEKKVVTKVQWDKRVERDDKPKPTEAIGETGDGEGPGTGKGKGPGDQIGPIDGEPCLTPPCGDASATPPVPDPPKPLKQVVSVPPTKMTALRIWGDTQIHPSRNVKNQIVSDRRAQVVGTVKVCIGESGAITSATMLGSTKYPEYDQQLLESVRRWRYRPYTVDGVPTPACSAVSFVYSIK